MNDMFTDIIDLDELNLSLKIIGYPTIEDFKKSNLILASNDNGLEIFYNIFSNVILKKNLFFNEINRNKDLKKLLKSTFNFTKHFNPLILYFTLI